MCGLAGMVGTRRSVEGTGVVERMVEKLRHRGPDGQGVANFDACAVLGHTRLSIVDLVSGAQPMVSADKRLAVTFNGEIYGYRDLKKSLSYPFRTGSDTEVLLALYEKHGRNMMHRLPGMFAFAIWDRLEKTLFCARDRFGEKPFYFAWTPQGDFLFASEIKAILATGLVDRKIRIDSLAYYLWQNHVRPDATIYSGIHVLPPAHWLMLRNGKMETGRYWDFPEVDREMDFQEAAQRFAGLMSSAVERQLVADVPVSGFLSSGLDSTTIMALAAQSPNPPKAFSFDFKTGDSEADIAENSCQKYGLEFQRIEVEHHDPADILGRLADVYDEPFADSSAIPTYLISQAASRFAKVALTGDGGDEMAGGYDYFYQPLLDFRLAKFFGGQEGAVQMFASVLWKTGFRDSAAGVFKFSERIREFRDCNGLAEALLNRRQCFSRSEIGRFLPGLEYWHEHGKLSKRGGMEEIFRCDIEGYMAGQILVKTDRASMAHGLELRAPFLDVDVANFLLSLPPEFKIARGRSKAILREAFSGLWTKSVSSAPKRGFDSPLHEWFLGKGLQKMINERLKDPQSRIWKILHTRNPEAVLVGRSNQQIFTLLCLAVWLDSSGTI